MEKREMPVRILFSIPGVTLAGISVGFLKLAAMGVDPFQTLMTDPISLTKATHQGGFC